jgi:endoglycosylceramidase
LLDRRGRVVEVHGLNLVIKRPPYLPTKFGVGADDARFLHRHGFTAVRLGVLMQALEPRPDRFDDRYLRAIVRTAHLLARHGVRSLVDFHQDLYSATFKGEGLPGWMVRSGGVPNAPNLGFPTNYFADPALEHTFDNFWANVAGPGGRGLQQWYAGAWRQVARAFRGDPAVLGYDIFNEPWPGTAWPTCFLPIGCAALDTSLLAPFADRIIRAIHSVDPRHIAYFEPWQSFGEGAATAVGAPGDALTGFSFHIYCAAAAGLPEDLVTRTACDTAEHSAMDHAVAQASRAGEALLLSEFGATSDGAELRSVVSYADAHSIPWLEWAYCACGDPTGSGRVESLVYDPTDPPRGGNVNHASLSWLDVPYPLRTAGTPLGYSFDRGSRTFRFRYSTRSVVDGHRLHAPTVIYLSRLHYPHGYRARVSGGTVVAHHSRRLAVRAGRRASVVSVVVTPRT